MNRLTLAGLNYLQVKVSDIENAYITAPCTEKIWTRFVPNLDQMPGRSPLSCVHSMVSRVQVRLFAITLLIA